ncbi:DUF4435 domain-containing protein [Corallincola platygyrae]|uniref:DUF4435 domain-containing protein n=1 Tax=Corallincola platygyrae TaxID=1193278 RepID=A0ABW4XL32_9GAMM
MSNSALPVWPIDALESIGLLYRDLQDIEVYVEDEDSEAIYRELLSRASNNSVKIHKLFCLDGRHNVVTMCEKYDDESPALFIIDGDLDLVLGEKEKSIPRLFQHNLYCMENYLFCKDAAIELLIESSGKILTDAAATLIDWDAFINSIKSDLENLFITFGTSRKLTPSEKTVAHSFYSICKKGEKKSQPRICSMKVDKLITDIESKIIKEFDVETLESVKTPIKERVFTSTNSLSYVSGKDFLIPALYFHLKDKGLTPSITMDSFKFRLARHCEKSPLEALANAMQITAKGEIYNAA